PDARPRPARRACAAARAPRGAARERRLRRAPPGGNGDLRRRDGGRADADDARRGALRGRLGRAREVGLPGRAAQVVSERRAGTIVPDEPPVVEAGEAELLGAVVRGERPAALAGELVAGDDKR